MSQSRRGAQERWWETTTAFVITIVVGVLFIVALLAFLIHGLMNGFGNNENSNTNAASGAITSNFPTEEISPSASTVPSATVVTPPAEASESIELASQEVKDAWFKDRLREKNITGSDEKMFELRNQVCDSLHADNSMVQASEMLSGKGMTEEQKGVVISSSMLSQCNDVTPQVPLAPAAPAQGTEQTPAANPNAEQAPAPE